MSPKGQKWHGVKISRQRKGTLGSVSTPRVAKIVSLLMFFVAAVVAVDVFCCCCCSFWWINTNSKWNWMESRLPVAKWTLRATEFTGSSPGLKSKRLWTKVLLTNRSGLVRIWTRNNKNKPLKKTFPPSERVSPTLFLKMKFVLFLISQNPQLCDDFEINFWFFCQPH